MMVAWEPRHGLVISVTVYNEVVLIVREPSVNCYNEVVL